MRKSLQYHRSTDKEKKTSEILFENCECDFIKHIKRTIQHRRSTKKHRSKRSTALYKLKHGRKTVQLKQKNDEKMIQIGEKMIQIGRGKVLIMRQKRSTKEALYKLKRHKTVEKHYTN